MPRRPAEVQKLGGTAIGGSGVLRIGGAEAAQKIRDGGASLDDFLLVSGAVAAPRAEIEKQMRDADLEAVPPEGAPWPQIWGLANVERGAPSPASDGTALWWASTQGGGGGGGALPPPAALPPDVAELADEALAEWLKFFAGHGGEADD